MTTNDTNGVIVDAPTDAELARAALALMERQRITKLVWGDMAALAQSNSNGVALPATAAMQFKLIDAKNALQHAAESATPEVAKVYRQRALEVAEIVSALSGGVMGTDGGEARMKWQPIETAPRDGTPYLAATDRHAEVMSHPPGCYPGQWSLIDGEWRGCASGFAATHWAPIQLPANGVPGTYKDVTGDTQ